MGRQTKQKQNTQLTADTVDKAFESVVETLTLGFTKPEVSVQLVMSHPIMKPAQASLGLRRVSTKGIKPVRQLIDLYGDVQVTTAEEALKFARLLTSPATFFLMSSGLDQRELEIVAARDVDSLPTYGCTKWLDFGCILPNEDNDDSPFFPPRLDLDSRGFVIERWLYVHKSWKTEHIQLVRESVCKSGEYNRAVLREITVPEKAESLYIPFYE
jgi:hypothetical protein